MIGAARRLVAEHMPRLAVVDVNLSGEMACGLIEKLHDHGVRVIVTFGSANPPVPMHKAAAILQKPFSASESMGALRG
jgi:DNA-binding NtrC family response regulator